MLKFPFCKVLLHTHTKFEILSVNWHKNRQKILILSIIKVLFICALFSAEGFTVNKLPFYFQDESHLGKITAHPRFLRFLGTCIDSSSNEVFILSDYVAGISLEVSKTKSKLKGKVSNML